MTLCASFFLSKHLWGVKLMECPFTFCKLTTDVASSEVQSKKIKCFTVAVATLFIDMNTRIVVVFKSWSNRDYIYGYLQKKRKCIYDVCHPEDYFLKVNRSNLCLESPCFFMLKGAELRDHYRISYWDITRKHFFFCVCFDVYYTSCSCCYVSLFCILFILILKAMSIFSLKHVPCFGYIQYLGICLLFCFALLCKTAS